MACLGIGACAWGPGMRIDRSGIEDRASAAGGPDAGFALVTISPQLIEEQRALAVKPLREADPLADLARTYQYKVAPYDVLSVTVWEHPELTIPAGEYRSETATGSPVTADGNIFYPHAGLLQVAGKTLPQIREMLTTKLTKVLQDPQLDVRVAAFRGYKVAVSGEVKLPSTLPITDVPLRALDAINLCQGATAESDLRRVILTREGKPHVLDLQALNEEGDLSQNWILAAGDVLHVSDRSLNKVFVLGEVKNPSSKFMTKGRMTLAEAIGDSQGLDNTAANAAGIYVIRGQYDRPHVYQLDATSPDALLLASAFLLQPMDVVFVSTHRLTEWNRIMLQIWPTIQAVTQPALYIRNIIPL